MRPEFIPASLLPGTPTAAKIMISVLPLSAWEEKLKSVSLTSTQYREAMHLWNMIYTISVLPERLQAAQSQRYVFPDHVLDDDGPPLLTREVADILGVSQSRVRQLAIAGELERVSAPGERPALLDPVSVRDYALRKHTDAA